jgi:hypothetical protein
MKKTIFKIGLLLAVFAFNTKIIAQPIPGTLNWYNGEGAGMQTDKAYGLLKKKTSQPVIVAVIDSGVDIEHEDLQGKIWVNTKEIPKNGIDDDKNGYIDDVHGWNFLGNAKGENLDAARLEKTRILAKLMEKYDGIDPATIAFDEEFTLYETVKYEVEDELANFEQYMPMLESGQFDKETIKYILDQVKFNLIVNYDDRSLIGDNVDDFNDKNYGNGDVEGPDALHGTHVSGIICAIRGNGKGGDGVADNVKIMSLRAVPNGDEQDKDIAFKFVKDHFLFIDTNGEEPSTLDSILERARAAVKRMGVRGLVIDPYNYIELPKGDGTETAAISDMLTRVQKFCKAHDVHTWFIAHPSKVTRHGMEQPRPDGMSIAGSMAWWAKTDCGITVHRREHHVEISVWKCRYRWVGQQGETTMLYNKTAGTYSENLDAF